VPGWAAFPGKPGLLVFSSTFAGNRDVFAASADGSNRVDLTRDPHADITPSWSADGRRIAFASNRSGAMEIYLANADGSGVVQLTHDGAFADDPRFTADGRYVVYESRKIPANEAIRCQTSWGGDLLCKQEVVGSIPSGSTGSTMLPSFGRVCACRGGRAAPWSRGASGPDALR
jgi:Tol biopolymer transport system component